ncbi:MAG: hypothetical protein KC506_03760 [Nanoarchaeota archaeon]|nr:hypothetical protein [Nanoarchaeota archaeon]
MVAVQLKGLDVSLDRLKQIRSYFSPRKARFVLNNSTEADWLAIDNTEGMSVSDYYVIAKANKIVKDEVLARRFEDCHPIHAEAGDDSGYNYYHAGEIRWWTHKFNALKMRYGREPSWDEIMDDFREGNDGLRYRVAFSLKNPEKVFWE